jgi:NADH dehydrogenase FAD-containing subunit
MAARIVVAGGGIAGVETVAAPRTLAGSRAEITMVAPTAQLEQRPMSLAAPFGDLPPPVSLTEIARRAPFELRLGELQLVAVERHAVELRDGERLAYDELVVATGAVARPAFPGAITFAGVADAPAVSEAVHTAKQLAFVSPTASGWALPSMSLR